MACNAQPAPETASEYRGTSEVASKVKAEYRWRNAKVDAGYIGTQQFHSRLSHHNRRSAIRRISLNDHVPDDVPVAPFTIEAHGVEWTAPKTWCPTVPPCSADYVMPKKLVRSRNASLG
jgi:hypothetical protein